MYIKKSLIKPLTCPGKSKWKWENTLEIEEKYKKCEECAGSGNWLDVEVEREIKDQRFGMMLMTERQLFYQRRRRKRRTLVSRMESMWRRADRNNGPERVWPLTAWNLHLEMNLAPPSTHHLLSEMTHGFSKAICRNNFRCLLLALNLLPFNLFCLFVLFWTDPDFWFYSPFIFLFLS